MPSRVRVPLSAAVGCAVAFVAVLAVAYGIPWAGRVDSTALNGLIALSGSRVRPIAELFVHSADPLPFALIAATVAGLGLALRRRRQAVAAVGVVGAATLTSEALKVALAHQRFDPALGAHQLGAAAYPSGHATAALALALAVVLVATPRLRPLAVGAGAVYAVGVSTSLLVLGWHFPSDVLGGMLVASFFFCLAVAALRMAVGRRIDRVGAARPLALARWRPALAVAATLVAVAALARAGDLVRYAGAHTMATVIAVAIAVCSAGLVWAAGALADTDLAS